MIVGFVPVRAGSKSIPSKNIKLFYGKPLLYWCIKAMQDSSIVDKIIVATDSKQIKEVAEGFGFAKLSVYDRDIANASDTSSTEDVMLEYLAKHSYDADDYFFLAQATNPFVTSEDVDNAFELLRNENADSLLTCVRFKRFFWNNLGQSINYDYRKRPRRQDFDGELLENGAFYISKISGIQKYKNRLSGKIAVYEMPEISSYEIDEPEDWIIMEYLFERFHKANLKDKIQDVPGIKLLLTDVDGVLTDAGMYYSESGDELKKFNTHDGMGFKILRENGVKTGIVTSENTKIVNNRAAKLKVDYLYQAKGYDGKLEAALEICQLENISIKEIAYIGDDINCFSLLSSVGVAACPSDAVSKIQELPNIIKLNNKGGEGAFREFVDWLFKNQYI